MANKCQPIGKMQKDRANEGVEGVVSGCNNFGGTLPFDLRNRLSPTIILLDNNELLDSNSPEVQQLTLLPEAEQRFYKNRRAKWHSKTDGSRCRDNPISMSLH